MGLEGGKDVGVTCPWINEEGGSPDPVLKEVGWGRVEMGRCDLILRKI